MLPTGGRIGISLAGSAADVHVLRVEAVDPAGKVVPAYSGNLRAAGGRASKLLPVALNDSAGQWTIRVKDVLSGQQQTATVVVD